MSSSVEKQKSNCFTNPVLYDICHFKSPKVEINLRPKATLTVTSNDPYLYTERDNTDQT